MKERIAKLIDLKSIVTLAITIALVVGWFMKKVPTDLFMPIVIMIYTFYFSKKDMADEIRRETITTETTTK